MARFLARVVGLSGLLFVMLGCGSRTELGVGTSSASDAGLPDAREDASAPSSCVRKYFCARPRALEPEARIDFDAVVGGNVQLGKGFVGPRGPTVAWGSQTCCNPDSYSASGLAVLGSAAETVTVAGPTATTDPEIPLPMLVNDGYLLGLDPVSGYQRGRRVELGTLALGPAFQSALGSEPDEPPSLERSGNRALALFGNPPRIMTLDTNLSTALGEQAFDGVGDSPMLTPTCDGFVASWVDMRETDAYGTMGMLALDPSGSPRGRVSTPPGKWNASTWERSSTWDGMNVVLAHYDLVLEVDPEGRLVSTTHVETAVVAFGTLDGLVVFSSDPAHSSNNRVRLVERNTGRVLDDFGSLAIGGFYAVTGSVVFGADDVYLATSSYLTRDALVWARIECSD